MKKLISVVALAVIVVLMVGMMVGMANVRKAKAISSGVCTITCAACYMPDGSLGGQDWIGHYELGPLGWYCAADYPETPCSNFC